MLDALRENLRKRHLYERRLWAFQDEIFAILSDGQPEIPDSFWARLASAISRPRRILRGVSPPLDAGWQRIRLDPEITEFIGDLAVAFGHEDISNRPNLRFFVRTANQKSRGKLREILDAVFPSPSENREEEFLARTIKTMDIEELSDPLLERAGFPREGASGKVLIKADLSGENLRGANLEWADLRGANLEWADLRGAKLEWADLRGANLEWVNFEWANLMWADLSGVNLEWENLEWANLMWANLEWANLRGARLRGAHLSEARLRWADFMWADLSDINLWTILVKVNLEWENLEWANLMWANLEWAHLRWAHLRWANLRGANLERADLIRAKYDNNTKFSHGFDPKSRWMIKINTP